MNERVGERQAAWAAAQRESDPSLCWEPTLLYGGRVCIKDAGHRGPHGWEAADPSHLLAEGDEEIEDASG